MADDNVIFNTLERVNSTDHNRLQELQNRLRDVWQRHLFAASFLDVSGVPGFGNDVARSSCAGLKVRSDGANGIIVSGGVLAQYSTTWPYVVTGDESNLRFGVNQNDTAIPLPTPSGGAWYVVRARVKDVVTVQETRDVFDPGSQTFSPQLLDKEQAREIEFDVLVGTSSVIPDPDSDNYVPLAYSFAPAGGAAPLDTVNLRDIAPRMLDGQDIRAWPATGADGCVEDFQFQTLSDVNNTASGLRVTGHFRGSAAGNSFRLEAAPNPSNAVVCEPDASWSAPTNTVVHVYLCPLLSGDLSYVPKQLQTGVDPYVAQQGVLIVTDVKPRFLTRENSGTIQLPAKYANFNGGAVPAGSAVHVASLATTGAGTAFRATAQSSSGRCMLLEQTGPYANVASYAAAGSGIAPMDLRNIVPPNAKVIRLLISGYATGIGVAEHTTLLIRQNGFTTALTFVTVPNFNSAKTTYQYVDVPVQANYPVDIYRNLEIVVSPSNSGVTTLFGVTLMGWQF